MADVSVAQKQRKRKLNFSVLKLNILTNKVEENFDILHSKLTNSLTNVRKNGIWAEITREVNAAGVACRTVNDIKEKWKKGG